MRWSELVRMAARNLRSRWGRTGLNVFGVVTGCTVLLLTASCGQGVRSTFYSMFDSSPQARRIIVTPAYRSSAYVDFRDAPEDELQVPDGIAGERRERIREFLAHEWADRESNTRPHPPQKRLTLDDVQAFANLEHAEFAIPALQIPCQIKTEGDPLVTSIGYRGARTGAVEYIVAGSAITEDDPDGVIIHEDLAYKLGYRTDDQLRQVIGKPLPFEYEVNRDAIEQNAIMNRLSWFLPDRSERVMFVAAFAQIVKNLERFGLDEEQRDLIRRIMPEAETGSEPGSESDTTPILAMRNRDFVVRGVFHNKVEEKSWDMFETYLRSNATVRASSPVVASLVQEQFERPQFNDVSVVVDFTRNLDAVVDKLKSPDVRIISARSVLDRVDDEINRVTSIVYWISGGIVFLTVLGICNTLFVSVLQRTPEFGIMKSLGASDRDVLCLMLLEGMICGLVGAIVAVFVSQGLAVAGVSLLEKYVIDSMHRDIDFDVAITLSPKVIVCTIIGSIIVCAIASILPAWRAARLDPVEAMRRT